MKKLFPLIITLLLFSCGSKTEQEIVNVNQQVKVFTTMGEFVIELSNKTPKHRDNFIQLVEKGAYDSIAFHRAIPKFIVQAGDMFSRMSPEEELELIKNEHTLPAEIDTSLFHKKGSLSMARIANIDLRSSGTHFTVQIGSVLSDSLLNGYEKSINRKRKLNYWLKMEQNQKVLNRYVEATQIGNWNNEIVSHLTDSILSIEGDPEGFNYYTIPQHQREFYKTEGGNAFLDQLYTVFGEVIQGMDVVEKISQVAVDEKDWPLEDVRILTMELIEK
ncbi:peptidylprolyl isomerase [Roseivirga sp.]|uniref:peptidylprolyl isomerase n=1 Tax=Roseivirga sp. TaxID=1964215 RepID=UPI003B8B6C29